MHVGSSSHSLVNWKPTLDAPSTFAISKEAFLSRSMLNVLAPLICPALTLPIALNLLRSTVDRPSKRSNVTSWPYPSRPTDDSPLTSRQSVPVMPTRPPRLLCPSTLYALLPDFPYSSTVVAPFICVALLQARAGVARSGAVTQTTKIRRVRTVCLPQWLLANKHYGRSRPQAVSATQAN